MMALHRTRRAWLDHTRAIAMEFGIPDSYRAIIMFLIRSPGASQKAIAEHANITTAAVNQTVKDMIRDEFIRKETDSADRRYTRLYLTQKGIETANRMRDRLHASDAVITALISPEKEAEMIRLLDQIHDCIKKDLK